MMKALSAAKLTVQNVAVPRLSPEYLRIKSVYAGVNRADLLQRAGKYPPPAGASEILGLEISGVVEEIGSNVTKFQNGDRVMALLSGGGYAEKVVVEEGLCLPIPSSLTLEQAGAIPENWMTAFQLTETAGGLKPTDSVLIPAAASGVGSALLQLSKAANCANIFAIVGSPSKAEFAKKLGATTTFLRHDKSLDQIVNEIHGLTNGKGVDAIFDCVGGSAFDFNLQVAALDAKWVLYGTLGGPSVAKVSLGRMLAKRLEFKATTLRSRSLDYRTDLVHRFNTIVMPNIISGKFQVQIDRVVKWSQAEEAFNILETNANHGKVLLRVDESLE